MVLIITLRPYYSYCRAPLRYWLAIQFIRNNIYECSLIVLKSGVTI